MTEPVSITDAFRTMSEEMATAYRPDPEESNTLVSEKIAAKYGIPFEDLIRAVLEEQRVCMLMMVAVGPGRAFVTAQTAAFLAGVRWEQGRH